MRLFDLLEQSTRTAAILHPFLRDRNPDLVVATPLVVLKTAQLDLIRAALELGIRNVFAAASWDHLSSKGLLSFTPQRVLVWNDVQKNEAIDLHHLHADRIVMTGAQVFDEWFDKKPSTSREAFCARLGLRPTAPSCSTSAHRCSRPALKSRPLSCDGFATSARVGIRFFRSAAYWSGAIRNAQRVGMGSISPGWTTSSAGHHSANHR